MCPLTQRNISHHVSPSHRDIPSQSSITSHAGGRSPHIMYPLTQGDISHEVSPSHRNILSHFVSSHRALPFMGEGKSPHIMCPPHTRISHTGGHLTRRRASHLMCPLHTGGYPLAWGNIISHLRAEEEDHLTLRALSHRGTSHTTCLLT